MRPRTLILVVAVLIIVTIATPIVITRYFLTPASQQRVYEQARGTAAAAATATP